MDRLPRYRRVAKFISDNLVSRCVWQDQLRLAAELNADGSMKKQFVYADDVNSPEYMIFDGKRYFFVKDHRGSINLVVNVDSGEVVQRMSYSEFGEVIEDTNPGFQPFGFAGGIYDVDTKLVKFGARDYDGKIGRWLSKDPIRFDGGDTNLYGYVVQDPINHIDPPGTGPVSGGVCAAIDIGSGMALGMAEWVAQNEIANAYQQQINNINMQTSGMTDCNRKSQLEMERSRLELLKAAALAKGSEALMSSFGASAVGGLICGGLLALPIP
jgi:RHS repeat-associated protein